LIKGALFYYILLKCTQVASTDFTSLLPFYRIHHARICCRLYASDNRL